MAGQDDLSEGEANWSDELEDLNEQSSGAHFIDVATRRAIVARVACTSRAPTMVDVGCSAGYLLSDLRCAWPDAHLIGVDVTARGLRRASKIAAGAELIQADCCDLPFPDHSVDTIVTANLLEHVPDDRRALAEMARVTRIGSRAVVVVPVGPQTYDYYDRFLKHERRYAHGEVAHKAAAVGFKVLEDRYLGGLLYPAFWMAKQRNRRRYSRLGGQALADKVKDDVERTKNSTLGEIACVLEEALGARGIHAPFGIRGLTLLERVGQ